MTAVLFGWQLVIATAICEPHDYIDHIDVGLVHDYVICKDGYKQEILWEGQDDK